jgi:hypothetical protein
MSDEHFTVDGTLVEAWASHKSFRAKDGTGKPSGPGGDVDFRGEKRKNQTHESTTEAQNTTNRRSAVDEWTTRHAEYEVSQRKRKRVEQSFGWMKMIGIGMLKKVKIARDPKWGGCLPSPERLTTSADYET